MLLMPMEMFLKSLSFKNEKNKLGTWMKIYAQFILWIGEKDSCGNFASF